MTKRKLLITEHVIVKDRKKVYGQIRRRQSVSGKIDFWQVRRDTCDWYGKYMTQEDAEIEAKERADK